jgi:hypothetical protein
MSPVTNPAKSPATIEGNDGPLGITTGRPQRAAAHLIDAVAAIEDREIKEPATRFITELIACSAGFRGAAELFQQQADALHEIDRGLSDPLASPAEGSVHSGRDAHTEGEWALAICALGDQLDDLVAMAEPSGFADPGELLDPAGSLEPLLGHMARLAEVAAKRGDGRFTSELLAWLRRGAEREERERRFLRRAYKRLARWPWNASGAMGRVAAADYPMIFGRLLPVERYFRAAMVRARHDFHGRRPDCRAATRCLERFRAHAGLLPPRMNGLLCAAGAQVLFRQLVHRTPAARPRCEIKRLLADGLAEAEGLLAEKGVLAEEDAQGLAALRRAISILVVAKVTR